MILPGTTSILMVHTHYHNSILIWRTVSCRVEEVIPLGHLRRVASRVIQWYDLVHEMLYCMPDQVTIMIICLLYAFFLTFILILKPVLVLNPEKLQEHFAITLCFLTSCQHVFCLRFYACNFLLRNVATKASNRC